MMSLPLNVYPLNPSFTFLKRAVRGLHYMMSIPLCALYLVLHLIVLLSVPSA